MLSPDVKQRLREGIEEFALPFDLGRWGEQAREAFTNLEPDGAVQALTPPSYASRSIVELASCESPFKRTFGLDGGSTRPIHFANGTTLCANQAVMVSEPPLELEGLPLEAFRTVALVTQSFAPSGGPRAAYLEEGLLGIWRIHLTRDYLRGEIDHVLKGLADAASEARHALRLAEHLNLGRDDMLFLDGNVFPIGLYYLVGARRSPEVDLTAFPGATRALAQHLRLAETMVERGATYAGINKTPQTSYLLGCLPEEGPWADDRQLIRAVFHDLPKAELGWTNWFLQVRYRLPAPDRGASDLFRQVPFFKLELPPEDYAIAYFFVSDPRTAGGAGSVLKVEVPWAILERHEPEKLQRVILAEIARGAAVPNVIRRADSRARITQEEREAFIRGSGLPPDLGYNQGRGEPW
ncbi:MAG: DNA double-strand break repair nuclease NurA [Candidatus Acetothermia bacterium]|nr:DNA double-strand break repair nuclease NurA [Candidatus Acetothermia bacterium]MDH7505567.1 DNA double-strand break repair nuclease NurA [Candidatus Acetothermia bacterium]